MKINFLKKQSNANNSRDGGRLHGRSIGCTSVAGGHGCHSDRNRYADTEVGGRQCLEQIVETASRTSGLE